MRFHGERIVSYLKHTFEEYSQHFPKLSMLYSNDLVELFQVGMVSSQKNGQNSNPR